MAEEIRVGSTTVKIRNPFLVFVWSLVTFGIYYLVWYYKINKELAAFAPQAVQVQPGLAVCAQFLPIFNWVSLARTVGRINAAHASIGSPVRASGAVAIVATFWYSSHTRYLQRRGLRGYRLKECLDRRELIDATERGQARHQNRA